MKIIHFNPYVRSYNITSSTIVTVHNEDKKTFKKYCRNYKVIPYKVYTLFNYVRGYENLVSYYLKHKFYKYYNFDKNLELLTVWDILLEKFNKKNFSIIESLITKIKSIDTLLNLEPLKNDLYTIGNLFQIPLNEEGLFLKIGFENKKKTTNTNCFNDYYALRDKLDSLKGQTSIININSDIDKIKNLFPQHNANIKDKYFFISLYFYIISLYHYQNKNYTVSFNMLHRMLDIYFEYLCKVDGLTPSKNYLWNKYEILSSSQSSYTFSTNEGKLVTRLNQSRNKLYLTHGLYSIRKIELKQMFVDLKKLIVSKSGVSWKNKVKNLDFNLKLKPLDLFKSEPSFNTYFKDITEEF